MKGLRTAVTSISAFVHRRFIWLLLAAYAVSAAFPRLGQWMRNEAFGEIAFRGERITLSLPLLMLAFLLCNAGVGTEISQLRLLARKPWMLVIGLVINLGVPAAFLVALAGLTPLWPDVDELETILVDLALVAAMPIAGSSTAWSQKADGNLALSLGLVLVSTLLSPWTTPLVLNTASLVTLGDYSNDLRNLAAHGTGMFLAIGVFIPSVLGIGVRCAFGEARIAKATPYLKLANSVVLLLLIYSNAALSLPDSMAHPDTDFLVGSGAVAVVLCLLAFASGWVVAWCLKANRSQRASLTFGLGMNNNGTGLLLASMALSEHPQVMLPIIFYNLVQHLVAGGVEVALFKQIEPREAK